MSQSIWYRSMPPSPTLKAIRAGFESRRLPASPRRQTAGAEILQLRPPERGARRQSALAGGHGALRREPRHPAQSIKREDVRRTIVLFVGDLLTSSESIPSIRTGLTKFVEEQVRPGDLVAHCAIQRGPGRPAGFHNRQAHAAGGHRSGALDHACAWNRRRLGIRSHWPTGPGGHSARWIWPSWTRSIRLSAPPWKPLFLS